MVAWRTLGRAANGVGDAGGELLAVALGGTDSAARACPNLETLNLDQNALRDRAASGLAELVRRSPTLTSLSVADNEVGNGGAISLAPMAGVSGPCALSREERRAPAAGCGESKSARRKCSLKCHLSTHIHTHGTTETHAHTQRT